MGLVRFRSLCSFILGWRRHDSACHSIISKAFKNGWDLNSMIAIAEAVLCEDYCRFICSVLDSWMPFTNEFLRSWTDRHRDGHRQRVSWTNFQGRPRHWQAALCVCVYVWCVVSSLAVHDPTILEALPGCNLVMPEIFCLQLLDVNVRNVYLGLVPRWSRSQVWSGRLSPTG